MGLYATGLSHEAGADDCGRVTVFKRNLDSEPG